MIEVENLTKNYGPARALRGISFHVARGEVVGFLGPNGAGKSTTMKILTGFLVPSSGTARIDGLDVVEDSLAVRRRIGYLPESTPLYGEMSVHEYLRFAAEIRGLRGKELPPALARVVELCGLERVWGKNILELSKGYRQRVGLAQAMVHQPDLLILDEPTSGLDPNQIVEVRSLIQRLGEEHTVILSTHYLQEVEAACTRVIVIDLGEIVADGTRDDLVAQLPPGDVFVRVAAPPDAVAAALQQVDGVHEVLAREGGGFLVRGDVSVAGGALEGRIAAGVVGAGLRLLQLERLRPSLEDAFRAFTVGRREGARDA
ncbi:MAG: ATP-binding cassette domain-containing protein [Planctomycetes bacterium]|nr:ATP-binding cassette domain-containing protein [Planctomycetota bacterium]